MDMYRSDLNTRDKGGAVATVIAIHAALLFALLHMSGRLDLGDSQATLRIFDVREAPPPPPPRSRQRPAPKRAGGSAPKNIQSDATPVVVPKPKVVVTAVNVIPAAETPGEGTQPTQGASDVRGAGTGSGSGSGTGNGSGNGGDQIADGPHLATPVLSGRDFPRETLDRWPRGATVFTRLRIDARGYVSECTVDRGTGLAAIDSAICNLAHERLRFRPAVNRNGQPVAGWFGYAQPAPR